MKLPRRQIDVTTEKQAASDDEAKAFLPGLQEKIPTVKQPAPGDEAKALLPGLQEEIPTVAKGAPSPSARPGDEPTVQQSAAGEGQDEGQEEEHEPFEGPDPFVGTRYRVLRELGRGGMGTVYLTEHRDLGRRFAVKVLSDELSSDAVVVERMRREARMASQIRHPGIVDVTDVGETPDGRAFIVMEHLEGEALSLLIHRAGRLDQLRALGIATRMCEALSAAHAHGVIHRDVKPANIVISGTPGREAIKIVDFGIALSPEHATGRLTQLGTMPGTPLYMAPEQATTRAATVLSDVYAAGVVLYEMLTGFPPFDEPTGVETLARKLRYDPQPPSRKARRAGISPAVDEVVLKAVARNPVDRYQSMEAFADGIDEAVDTIRFGAGGRRGLSWRSLVAGGLGLGMVALAVGGGIAAVRATRGGGDGGGGPDQPHRAVVMPGSSKVDDSGPARDDGGQTVMDPPGELDAGGLALLRAVDLPGQEDGGWSMSSDADVAVDGAAEDGSGSPAAVMSRAARREMSRRLAAEARRHLRARRLGDARAAYVRAGRLDPGNSEVQGGLGRVAFEQGRYREASRHLERALRSRPRSTGLRIVLGSAYLRMGKTSHARRQWEQVLRQDPDNRAAKRLLDSVR